MKTIYTVGHSTRTLEEFLELLQSVGIRCLVDVRRFPGSRRYPHFNRENLAQSLAGVSLDYRHFPELGGRRDANPDSPNQFWRVAAFRGYADYMSTSEFQDQLHELERIAGDQLVAIMCAEAVPWRCHRQLISDALTADGWEVQHLMAPGKSNQHVLNTAARVNADRSLTYPGPGAEAKKQSSLFD
jgi:uncharacterized protein (DUF488 family)